MRKLVILLAGVTFFLQACAPPEKEHTVHERHNYIILLDLSDRLIKQPDQVERDKALIKEIYSLFEEQVRKELYIRSKDAIKVVLAHQEGSPVKPLVAEEKLFINMENIHIKDRKKLENERRTQFFAALNELYEKAHFSAARNDYKGADIGKYFEDDIRRDLVGGEEVINYVFLLTDGYMYVEGKQSGLGGWRPVNRSFENLSVMLLETDPINRDGEWDKMQHSWLNWFSRMGVRNVVVEKRTAMSKVNELMKKFVENGNEQIGYNLPLDEYNSPRSSKVNINAAKDQGDQEKKNNIQ